MPLGENGITPESPEAKKRLSVVVPQFTSLSPYPYREKVKVKAKRLTNQPTEDHVF
jgi:hypothetical protein